MVSSAHRFLANLDLLTSSSVVLLQGLVDDTFYHDAYHGCVDLRTTLSLWARGHSNDVVAVTLTRDGALEPVDQIPALDALVAARPRRHQHVFRPEAANQSSDEETRAAASAAAEQLGAATAGQGTVNQLRRVKSAFEHAPRGGLVVIVENLAAMFEDAPAESRGEFVRVVQELLKCAKKKAQPGCVLVLIDEDSQLPRVGLIKKRDAQTIDIGRPGEREIAAFLTRADRRHHLSVRNLEGITAQLALFETLDQVIHKVATIRARNEPLSMAAVLDLPEPDFDIAESVLAKLRALPGLEYVAAQLESLRTDAENRLEELMITGVLPGDSLHLVFEGPPGTGKTTIAHTVAELFHALSLISSSKVTEIDVDDLTSSNVAETTERMVAALDGGLHGVIFIDEAYRLVEDEHKREAIGPLMKFAEEHRSDTVVILAGYTYDLGKLFEANPGMNSRFPKDRRILFRDYGAADLLRIVEHMADEAGWAISEAAKEPLTKHILAKLGRGGFGNARGARNLWEDMRRRHRAQNQPGFIIGSGDVPPIAEKHPVEQERARQELSKYIGVTSLQRYLDDCEVGVDFALLTDGALPPVRGIRFVGPPGTGKTETAQIIARYLYGIGFLESPSCLATASPKLKAGFLGQTQSQVAALFKEACGGVLFIDEIYGLLGEGPGDAYGQEAVDTMTDEFTKDENKGTLVIVAGYEDRVARFLRANDGLASRMPGLVVFDPPTNDELLQILRAHAEKAGYTLDADFDLFFFQVADQARRVEGDSFGNVRWAINVFEQAATPMQRRVIERAGSRDEVSTVIHRKVIHREDLVNAVSQMERGRWMPPSTPIPAAGVMPPPRWDASAQLLVEPSGNSLTSDEDAAVLLRDASFPLVVDTAAQGRGIGTAFQIAADGLAVTAAHVVENAIKVVAYAGVNDQPIDVTVVSQNKEVDVALVLLGDARRADRVPLALGDSMTLASPHRLVAAGYDHCDPDEDCHVVLANVSKNSERDPVHFDVDGAIEFGASGGPVLDPDQGAVVGIVHGGVGSTVKVMTRAEQVLALLAAHGWTLGGTAVGERGRC